MEITGPFLCRIADELVMCGMSEEDLRAMMGQFVEVYRRRDLKVNAGKSKVVVLNEKQGLECEACVNGMRREYVGI